MTAPGRIPLHRFPPCFHPSGKPRSTPRSPRNCVHRTPRAENRLVSPARASGRVRALATAIPRRGKEFTGGGWKCGREWCKKGSAALARLLRRREPGSQPGREGPLLTAQELSLARVRATSRSKRTGALLGEIQPTVPRSAIGGCSRRGPNNPGRPRAKHRRARLESLSVERRSWIAKSPLSEGSDARREVLVC